MDYDGDGHRDLISGSYDPGECYVFRGEGKGKFRARETLCDREGHPILHRETPRDRVEAFGSWITAVDWEADGDIDLVIGSFDGGMFLRRNEGMRAKPAYASKNERVQADGKDLEIPGHHGPLMAIDWDGDGLWDLVAGSATGAVWWWRNVGTAKEPLFGAALKLVDEHQGNGYEEFLENAATPPPGIRSQIFVTDWNKDGKADLLVGDFCTTDSSRTDLSDEDREKLRTVLAAQAEMRPALAKLDEEIDQEWSRWYKAEIPAAAQFTDDSQARMRKKREEIAAEKGRKPLGMKMVRLGEELRKYLARPAKQRHGEEDWATPHGFVWLFLRK